MMKCVILLSILMPMACYGGLVGGPTDIKLDANDANVLFAVNAINSFHAKLGDSQTRTLVEVTKATSQVVAGVVYTMTLRLTTGSQEEVCEVKVWSRPWLSGDQADEATQLSGDPTCKAATDAAKSHVLGGETTIDANDADVQNALSFAVQGMNARENFMFQRKPVKINKVTSQVVSGMSYHFYGVHMAATDCTKSGSTPLENCNVADNADTKMCDFSVWWQSWTTPEYKLLNVDCK